jgi:hypothetical protein
MFFARKMNFTWTELNSTEVYWYLYLYPVQTTTVRRYHFLGVYVCILKKRTAWNKTPVSVPKHHKILRSVVHRIATHKYPPLYHSVHPSTLLLRGNSIRVRSMYTYLYRK